MAKDDGNSAGRRRNAAQPLGERKGLTSNAGAQAAARKEQVVGSADNLPGKVLGETFKRPPGKRE
jgi:hypothetical protein